MHEVQDAVVRAPEAVLLKYRVRVASKAPIRKVKQLDTGDQVGIGRASASVLGVGGLSRCAAMF
ncbi:protein of unknown function [Hyphomicrobium sp. MC1]|nr:protein of unknown function [Hyphomicrobium sp. MC1]